MLEVVNIEKSYGKKKILHDISFSIEKGQIKALVGPNGSGKTTLMNTMTNLLKRDGGQVLVDAKSLKMRRFLIIFLFSKMRKSWMKTCMAWIIWTISKMSIKEQKMMWIGLSKK